MKVRRCKLGRGAAVVGAALALSALLACVNIPFSEKPPRLFVLTPKSTFATDLPTVDWQLLIEVPIAAAGLDTTRIALQHQPTEMEYFAGATWTNRAPEMVQTLLVESFENSGKIVAVGRDSISLRSDMVLKTELREFQAEYKGTAAKVHVRINAKLIQMPQRSIVGSVTTDEVVAARGAGLEAIIAAFDDSLGKVLKEIVEWSLRTGDKAKAAETQKTS